MKKIFNLLKTTLLSWNQDNAAKEAAALSFYTTLSLPALLIVIIGITALFIDKQEAINLVRDYSALSIGKSGSETLTSLVSNIPNFSSFSLSAIAGFIFLIISASGILSNLQSALNTMWNVTPKAKQGWKKSLQNKILFFLLIIALGIIVTLSILLQTIVDDILQLFPFPEFTHLLISIISFVVGFALLASVSAIIFKTLPNTIGRWKEIWIGSIFTTVLLTIGNLLVGLYLQHTTTTTAFGVAGSVITILLWIYYSYNIFLLGAKFTQCYAKSTGHKIRPDRSAEADTILTHIKHMLKK